MVPTDIFSGHWSHTINGGVLATQLDQLMTLIGSIRMSNNHDSWRWSFGVDNMFMVKEARLW